MSSLIVEVCNIEEVKPHNNADRLEMARVKNWWCVVKKEQYKVGDKVVYLPPDSVITKELADGLGVTNYCGQLPKNPDGTRPTDLRIRASRLRGERSFGLIIDPASKEWEIGKDVKEWYNVKKYEPPIKTHDGDAATPLAEFHKYTDIENIGNFPGIFSEGEEVVVTEKIHGSNCRVGMLYHPDEEGNAVATFVAGSHDVRRKEFDLKGNKSRYWLPLDIAPVRSLIQNLFDKKQKPVIVFGEIFGAGIQDMQYGQKGISFRAFDISVNGDYLDYDEQVKLFDEFGVEMVPVLYRGPFSMQKVEEIVDGPTTIVDSSEIKEKFKGREGVVIKPVVERVSGDLNGRTVLKCISVDYHERKNKNKTEHH